MSECETPYTPLAPRASGIYLQVKKNLHSEAYCANSVSLLIWPDFMGEIRFV